MSIYDIKGNAINDNGMISVLDFGADNTGMANSTSAIQNALDNCNFVYFPKGTYLLTSKLSVKENSFLYFEEGAVLKRNSSMDCMMTCKGDTSVTGYDGVHDITIYGATFDVNGSVYTYNCTALSFCHAKRIKTVNCKFINHTASWHQLEYSACMDSIIEKCYFDATGHTSESVQIESPYNSAAWPWNNGAIDSTPSLNITVKDCVFENGATALGRHGGGSAKYVNIHDCVFRNFSSTVVQFYGGTNIAVHDCIFTDCGADTLIRDGHTKYNNTIDGVFTP